MAHGLGQLRVPLRGKGGVRFGERHHLAAGDHRVQGRAQQIQVAVVAGGGGSGQRGDRGGATDAVPAVRPGPAVVPAVPAPAEQAADHPVRADVVRHDPVVRGGALPPRADVLLDPVPVARVAGQDPGVQDEPGGREVDRGVARAHAGGHLTGQPPVLRALGLGRAVGLQPVEREAVSSVPPGPARGSASRRTGRCVRGPSRCGGGG